MYTTVQFLHSYWAYLVLLVLVLATANALIKLAGKKEFEAKDLRISLFGLITSHIQLLIGLILLFVSPYFETALNSGMSAVMKDATLRLYLVEHPLTNIIAIVLITIGWSRHKKKVASSSKFKNIGVFYLLGLLLLLSRIPYQQWFS